jgi:hypothetical protein
MMNSDLTLKASKGRFQGGVRKTDVYLKQEGFCGLVSNYDLTLTFTMSCLAVILSLDRSEKQM